MSGVKMSCMAKSVFPPGTTMELARDIKRAFNHGEQIGEVNTAGIGESDDHHGLVRGGYPPGAKRIGGINNRHSLEVDVSVGELGNDVMDVIVHAAQDSIGDRFGGVAAFSAVTVELLNPFQVDNGYHPNT